MKYVITFLFLSLCCNVQAQPKTMLSGRITATDGTPVEFASVYLEGTNRHTLTDKQGLYHLHAPAGRYTLGVSMLGYKPLQEAITLDRGRRTVRDLTLTPAAIAVDEVVVSGKSSVQRINASAYNAIAIDAKALHNSTQDIASALSKVSGVKLRETGGVGSEMQLSLDGFSGRHIKLFIDGVPQEGVGGALTLNNIPVNFAERIEIYKGVVPVGFGADAIGGVVNIVTGNRRRFFVDASYSYGSFNTHRSYLNVGQTLRNGLLWEINAFQNYSDNSYWVDTPVKDLENGQIDRDKIERVRRFHDNYHNEAVIGKIGISGKKYADKLLFGVTFSNSDKEIQTGVRQEIVFGQKRRKAQSIMPSFEYRKRDLFTRGLNVALTVNYNHNVTHNIDTATRTYNWRGESIYNNGKLGEQSYQDDRFSNDNWNGTFTASYRIDDAHSLLLNHVLSAFSRKTLSSANAADNASVASAFGKTSMKNITGLSYRYNLKERFNLSVFGKYYNQHSQGPRNASSTGGFDYALFSERVDALGYGAAATCFIIRGLQAKLSYEKAFRMPTTEELFGDEDLELGAIGLRPENSHNANLSLSYGLEGRNHTFYIEAGAIFRDTRDYIRRTINSYSGGLYYGLYENHGRVQTKGINAELRYGYSDWLTLGGNISYLDIRDKERYVGGNTQQQSTTYGVRIPNTPYLFANGDLSFTVNDCLRRGNTLVVSYGVQYVHEFTLYWENHGDTRTKQRVPTQLSHDVSLRYSLKNGRYNFSVECRNLTDERLYDNFSLQKAGRAFYGKFRFYFGK